MSKWKPSLSLLFRRVILPINLAVCYTSSSARLVFKGKQYSYTWFVEMNCYSYIWRGGRNYQSPARVTELSFPQGWETSSATGKPWPGPEGPGEHYPSHTLCGLPVPLTGWTQAWLRQREPWSLESASWHRTGQWKVASASGEPNGDYPGSPGILVYSPGM